MKEFFELAYGTVLGRNHRGIGRNNQDAIAFSVTDQAIVAVLCDGCSDGEHNEVGANIGARIFCRGIGQLAAKAITESPQTADGYIISSDFWQRIHQNTLAYINLLASAMGASLTQTIRNYFLFTLVGALVTRSQALTFALGDGAIMINGEITQIGPYPQNEPPYLSYNLTGTSAKMPPELLKIQIIKAIPTADIQSILIGTDGLMDFIKSAEKRLPGKEEIVGPVSQFWENDRYFANPDLIRRRLFAANKDTVKYLRGTDHTIQDIRRENGLLPDDTSLIVIRRRKEERSAA